MFKRYLLAITFCLSSIFFFSGILYSTTQKIIKLDTHSKNTTAFIVTQYTHNPLQSTNYVQSILQYLLNPYIAQIQIFSSSIH